LRTAGAFGRDRRVAVLRFPLFYKILVANAVGCW
jgi:hypothetical protein